MVEPAMSVDQAWKATAFQNRNELTDHHHHVGSHQHKARKIRKLSSVREGGRMT
jgi:hypothetical protein